MKTKSKSIVVFLLIAFAWLNPAHSINKISEVNLDDYGIQFKGRISERNITMYLRQEANQVEGLYVYGRNSIYLKLKGEVDPLGSLRINEFNSYGSNTGVFIGTCNADVFFGNWQKPDGRKSQSFILTLVKGALVVKEDTNDSVSSKTTPYKTLNGVARFFIALAFFGFLFLGFSVIRKNKKKASISNVLKKAEEQTDETPEQKGANFEKYVAGILNNAKNYLKIIDWRSDKYHKGIYAESNSYPDFKVNLKYTNVNVFFAIECKYRTSLNSSDLVTICNEKNMDNYWSYSIAKKIEVFIVLGVGGRSMDPEKIYIIPLRDLKSGTMKYSDLEEYLVRTERERFYYDFKVKRLYLIKIKSTPSTTLSNN